MFFFFFVVLVAVVIFLFFKNAIPEHPWQWSWSTRICYQDHWEDIPEN